MVICFVFLDRWSLFLLVRFRFFFWGCCFGVFFVVFLCLFVRVCGFIVDAFFLCMLLFVFFVLLGCFDCGFMVLSCFGGLVFGFFGRVVVLGGCVFCFVVDYFVWCLFGDVTAVVFCFVWVVEWFVFRVCLVWLGYDLSVGFLFWAVGVCLFFVWAGVLVVFWGGGVFLRVPCFWCLGVW